VERREGFVWEEGGGNKQIIMATYSNTCINCDDIELFIKQIKKHFKIYEVKYSTTPYDFFYEGNQFIIISQNFNQNWINVQFDFGADYYIMDEIIKELTSKFGCDAMLCYYQSTIVEGRFAYFEKGELSLSITQKEVELENGTDLRLLDNFGVAEEFAEKFRVPKIKNRHYSELDTDELYRMKKHFGLEGDGKKQNDDYFYLMLTKTPPNNNQLTTTN
jgi:hypothetical protein